MSWKIWSAATCRRFGRDCCNFNTCFCAKAATSRVSKIVFQQPARNLMPEILRCTQNLSASTLLRRAQS